MKTILMVVVALIIVVLIAAQQILSYRFLERIEGLKQQLAQAQQTDPSPVGPLPELVRAFAIKAGAREGGSFVVSLTQSVSMRFGPDQPWQELRATHVAGTRVSGFVWHATGVMNFLPIGVVDAFVEGRGLLNARILNAVFVASSEGPATDRGELLRYLAEIPLTPDVILNNSSLNWVKIDESTVLVSALSSEGPVRVEFSFDESGDIVEAFSASRPMGVGNISIDMPWRGRFFDYQQLGPRRISSRVEVGWELPEGFYLYFRGTIESNTLE